MSRLVKSLQRCSLQSVTGSYASTSKRVFHASAMSPAGRKHAPAHTLSHFDNIDTSAADASLLELADSIEANEDARESLAAAQEASTELPVAYAGLRKDNVYAPYDLKKERMVRSKIPRAFPARLGPPAAASLAADPIRYFDIRLEREVMNPILLNEFVTEMGKIKGRNETGLTRRTQRMAGKAIRRARAMGIMPTLQPAKIITFRGGDGKKIDRGKMGRSV